MTPCVAHFYISSNLALDEFGFWSKKCVVIHITDVILLPVAQTCGSHAFGLGRGFELAWLPRSELQLLSGKSAFIHLGLSPGPSRSLRSTEAIELPAGVIFLEKIKNGITEADQPDCWTEDCNPSSPNVCPVYTPNNTTRGRMYVQAHMRSFTHACASTPPKQQANLQSRFALMLSECRCFEAGIDFRSAVCLFIYFVQFGAAPTNHTVLTWPSVWLVERLLSCETIRNPLAAPPFAWHDVALLNWTGQRRLSVLLFLTHCRSSANWYTYVLYSWL